MSQNIVYVGIDVDDRHYHGSALDQCTGEVLDFQCRATLKGLVGQFDKVQAYFGRSGGSSKISGIYLVWKAEDKYSTASSSHALSSRLLSK